MSVMSCCKCDEYIDTDFVEGWWDGDDFYCEECAEKYDIGDLE